MTKLMNITKVLILVSAVWLSGCGEKLDLSQFPINGGGGGNISDTLYVQIFPEWTGYNNPRDVIIGNEPLIYIADTDNNRIVQLDIGGGFVSTVDVLRPIRLAMDNNLDILAICDSITPLNDTINVVYRYRLFDGGGLIGQSPRVTFITSAQATPISSRRRKFTGVATFPDNSVIISRVGPDNSSLIDPDNSLLKVTGRNTITSVQPYSGFQTTGNGIFSIEKTSSVITFRANPTDFILTRNTTDFGFKVEWFEFDQVNGSYNPKYLPETNADIVRIQLGTPQKSAVDDNNNVYVIDSARDSLYKFNNLGALRSESFGGTGSGENQFSNPFGVAVFNRVVYIADTGNGRIVRYKLSTDLN